MFKVFMTTPELMEHHRHLLKSLDLLAAAEPSWKKDDRERAIATRRNLKQEIARVEGDLHMAGARRQSA